MGSVLAIYSSAFATGAARLVTCNVSWRPPLFETPLLIRRRIRPDAIPSSARASFAYVGSYWGRFKTSPDPMRPRLQCARASSFVRGIIWGRTHFYSTPRRDRFGAACRLKRQLATAYICNAPFLKRLPIRFAPIFRARASFCIRCHMQAYSTFIESHPRKARCGFSLSTSVGGRLYLRRYLI